MCFGGETELALLHGLSWPYRLQAKMLDRASYPLIITQYDTKIQI